MQKFCKAVQNEEGIEELHKLIWNFPKEDKYSGKYAEEMKRVKEDTEVQYEKIWHRERKRRRGKNEEEKDEPYKGMKEKIYKYYASGKGEREKNRTLLAGYTGKKGHRIFSTDICGITATEQKIHGSLQKRTGQQCS